MIRFEGVETFPIPPAQVFARLADAGWVAHSLPEVEVGATTADRAEWKVKPKFAFMAGNLDTVADVAERADGERVRYRVVSKGVGSSSTLDATATITPTDGGGTAVRWAGELTELGGLLKMVPRGLLQAAAQKVIADIWDAVRQKLAA